ncbi:DNA-binding protein [Photobacterium gaetbulicola]|uniref:VC1465 family Xer recombination activation factor n=1 Tax=Photobacterium gaetbulicola TaxID=1295392 RepID=UPI000D156B41|nr:VC1465 family Xer recombination activation factor [Photobacterium gaetbulicola]PST98531.1 DNA-binding protein [Photobacterium gaetbulicola]
MPKKKSATKNKLAPNYAGPAWIKAAREKYGLTKAQAAEMCDVTTATWNRWETGKFPMNPCIFHYWLSVLEKRIIPRSGKHGRSWDGWFFEKGDLISPLEQKFCPSKIEGLNEQVQSQKSVIQHAQKVRHQARNGLNGAGDKWQDWKFEAGFLVSPDGRKIGPDDLYRVLAGLDAMNRAENKSPTQNHDHEAVVLKLA